MHDLPSERFGWFIRGDLWLVEGSRILALVRFQKVIKPNTQREMLAFDKDRDWAEQVRTWWLVGGTDHLGNYGKLGGHLACTQCSRALHVWQPGKLLGVECVTKYTPPVDLNDCKQISENRWEGADRPLMVAREIAEAKRWDLPGKQRGSARYQAERERLAQEPIARQTFVGQPDGRHERIRDRDRHAQELARTEQQVRAKSPAQECLEQEQREWAELWTPERAREAQAQARERDRQSSKDGSHD